MKRETKNFDNNKLVKLFHPKLKSQSIYEASSIGNHEQSIFSPGRIMPGKNIN